MLRAGVDRTRSHVRFFDIEHGGGGGYSIGGGVSFRANLTLDGAEGVEVDEGRIAHSSGAGIIQRGAAARPLADDAAVEELLAADLLAPGLWAPGLTGGAPCTTLSYRRSPVRQAVTVSLPPDLGDELRAASRDAGVSRSAVVREALRRYLADRDFQRLRRRLVPEAEQRGLFTDEDVFRRLA